MEKKKEEKTIIGVHIKGEVNAPGYYELSYGSRLKDVIDLAGGETESADLSKVNMAIVLRDGEEIVIPESGGEVNKNTDGKVNINSADLYQLCKLDGVGEVLANNILEYRAKNGPFKSIDAIKKVDGIGEEKFKNIKSKITI